MSDIDELRSFMGAPSDQAPGPQAAGSDLDSLRSFMKPELDEDKFGTAGQQAITGIEGAARGASLGLSDLAETKLLGMKPDDIKARMRVNPATSFAGSVAGGAGLIAATGGIAAPAEAGLGGAVAAGAAEGGLFGAGSAVSDYALGDSDLNASKILSDIGVGTALGVGAGAAGYGLKSLVGKFGGAKNSASELIAGEADSANRAAQTADAVAEQSGLKDTAPEVMSAAERLNLPVMNGMVSDNPWVQKAEDALINGAPTYSGIKRAGLYADAYNGAVEHLNQVVPDADSGMTKATVGSALKGSITSGIEQENAPISELYETIKQNSGGVPLSEKSAPTIARNMLAMDEVRISPSSPEAQLIKRVAEEIPNLESIEDIKSYRSLLNRNVSPTASAGEKRIVAILSDKLKNWEESSIERYAGKLKDSLADADPEKQEIFRPVVEKIDSLLEQKKAANALYKPFIEKVGTLAEQLGKRKIYGPQDAIDFINGLTPEQVSQRLFSKNNSEFLGFFEKNFPQEMALMREYQKQVLREAASKTGTFSPKIFFNKLNDLEPEIQRSIFYPEELSKIRDVETYLRSLPKNFNPSGTSGMSAFRHFFESPTGALIGNARDFGIEAFIKTMGALPEGARPNAFEVGQEMAEKYNNFNAVRNVTERTGEAIKQNARALLSGSTAGATSQSISSYDQKVDRIKELSENRNALAAHLSNHVEGISRALPNISQSLTSSMANSVNFLNSKIPRPPQTFPLSGKWQPSVGQKQKFNKYFDAVNDPVSVMKQVRAATLSNESLEALQAVHPQLLQEMRDQMQKFVDPEKARALPRAQKQALAMFMGQPLDESQLQPVMAANQMSFAALNQSKQAQAQQTGNSTLGGLKQLNVASRIATGMDKRDQNQVG